MHRLREHIGMRDAERFEAYRLFEEKTDIGERLSLPIENHLVLEVHAGGVYGRNIEGKAQRMTEWSRSSLEAALGDDAFSGANAVERVRRLHEYHEALEVETMIPGDAMVVLSPIPDAALRGELNIQGYRSDLARTFCRLYYREESTVHAVTLSLEQSNKRALQATATELGWTLPESMSSEDILASRHLMKTSRQDFETLPERLRFHYDRSLYEQTGTVFFAGNRLAGRQDSMRFMNDNHDIIDEHMAVLRSLEARLTNLNELGPALEMLRQRTAAALDLRLHGGYTASISDTEVGVRMATHDYGGECAVGAQASTSEQLGLSQGTHVTNCPLCGTRGVTATVEGETITCSDCRGSVDICSGKVTYGRVQNRTRQEKPTQGESVQTSPEKKQTMQEILSARYGQKVSIKRQKIIGGEEQLVLDRNGNLLQKIA